MANSRAVVKFFNYTTVPPRGGWVFTTNGVEFHAFSESELVDGIEKWQRNNGRFESRIAIEAEIWEWFCAREPGRCGISAQFVNPGLDVLGPLVSREITKELQGPPIWTFLNTLAVQWNEGLRDYFIQTVAMIPAILECPLCRAEFRSWVSKNPPERVNSKLEACQWVLRAHNNASREAGKSLYSYDQMVREWGAPTA